MITQDLGIATAYGYAKSKGYTGTEAEFAELMASYAEVGQTAVTAAQTATTKASEAATSATTATNKASEATTAATTATTKAGEASTSESTATSAKDTAVSASQTATTKATEATTAAATATSAATTATTAKDDAVSAKTAAQTAQAGAETAAASVQSSAAQIQTNADDISELKEDFNDISIDTKVSTRWVQGYINNSTGAIGSDSQSCATDYIESNGYEYFLTVGDGYSSKVALYNPSKTFVELVSAISSGNKTFRVAKGNFVRVQVTSSASLTPSSITDNIIKIDERTYTDKALSRENIPADAKAVGDKISTLTDINSRMYGGMFEKGSYNTATGAPASANYRLRTVDYIPIDVFISATCGTGYGLIVFAWNDDTYLGASNASFADATNVTVSTVKSKYPTATQVKVAFSNLSGTTLDPSFWASYGLAVNVYIKSADLADKIDQTYYVTGLMETSNNLFNALSAKDNTSLSSSDGSESYNTDRWATGFIAYDSIKHPLMIYSRMFPHLVLFYNENKEYIGNVIRNEYPYAVPSGTAYVRVLFSKTTVAFENRWAFYLGYADGSQVAFANKVVDSHYYDTKSRGYIDISDAMQHADENGAFKSSFTMVILRCEDAWKNLILSVKAMYNGDNAPTLKFRYSYGSLGESDNSSVFTSREYALGGKDYYLVQEFRNPPFPKYQQLLFVVVTIPTGTTLYIDDIHTEYSNSVNRRSCGTRFNAHQGFIQLCPQDSISGYAMAAKLGFDCCVTIPKETSDGVLVCFHDDNAVGIKLVDANGDVLSAELQAQSINQFTYAELSQLYINPESTIKAIYPKEKIPTLEEFFAVCAKTGMHPMLSVHPNLSQSGWESVKALAEKYGLLESLNIKIGYALAEGALSLPYSVFGNDIESYTIDVNAQTDGTAYVSYLDAELSGATCRVCVEYFYSVITATNIANTLSGGYAVACAEMGRATTAEIKRLMSLGVTEFTSDYFASVGLNW